MLSSRPGWPWRSCERVTWPAFDEGSLDAPGARDAARGVLGEEEFAAAYERCRALGRDEALALASGAVAEPRG
jgi:hypothetical protein